MKNNYRIEGDKAYIEVFCKDKCMETVVDLADLEKVKSHEGRWYAWYSKDNDAYYVCGWKKQENGKLKTFYLHRFLYDEPKGMLIDHINHNTLDNTRKNTRVVTVMENQNNRRKDVQLGKSKIRNVSWCAFTGKWRVIFKHMGKRYDLGRFDTIEEAVKARDEAKSKL